MWLLLLAVLSVTPAYAEHEEWRILREKQIEEGTGWSRRFHMIEKCARLKWTLPRIARVASVPCATNPEMNCLPNGSGGWHEAGVIYVPVGNTLWFDHSAIHYLKEMNLGDPDAAHSGDEWRECHR